MMKKFLLLALLCLTGTLAATNLLENGELSGGTGDVPDNWLFDYTKGTYYPDGGPDNGGFVVFSAPADKTIAQSALRQKNITLVPGEKYRISGLIRTRNLKARIARMLIHDDAWRKEVGSAKFPENTDGWQPFSREIVIPETAKNPFGVAVYLKNYHGELAISRLTLEPLTKAAKQKSAGCLAFLGGKRFATPIVPRLTALPAHTKFIPVSWPYGKEQDVYAQVQIDGKSLAALPLTQGRFQIPVADFKTGRHHVTLAVMRETQRLAENAFDFEFAPPPLHAAEKRLNPLTTELLARDLTMAGPQSCDFTVPRRTWVYFKLENTPPVTLSLTQDPNPLITPASPRPEAQRRLSPGRYTLTWTAPVTGKLIIRTVPTIYKYGGIDSTNMPGMGGYDLDFHQKYVFGVYNTIGTRGVKEELRPYTATLGLECADSTPLPAKGAYTPATVRKFVDSLNAPDGAFARPSSQWVEFDEYSWRADDRFLAAADGLAKLRNPLKKDLFHWVAGASGPENAGVHHKVMSDFMNAGDGRGHIAYEVYFNSKPEEQDAARDIRNVLHGSVRRMNEFIPDSNHAFGYVFGNFHQLPILSLDYQPQVNFKYFLDMQMHTLATSPEFNGIALVGFWGCNYANEEINRWSCALIRHYILEGRTDRLSDRYGYHYLLPYLKNNDFTDGLSFWQTKGNITTGSHRSFGAINQLRWGGYGVGDTFAVFHGGETPNELRQTAQGLIPGTPYVLEFITADYDDTRSNRFAPRKFAITVELPGAEIEKEFTYIDQRVKGRYGAENGKTNYRYYRFVPSSATQELLFRDAGKPGENLIMNYVRIAPYFAD